MAEEVIEKEATSISINKDILREFKKLMIDENLNVSEKVEELMKKYLDKKK